jgi:2-dehydropantoate 2-reductase
MGNSISWYVLGAGALGCLWASYWRRGGAAVTLITRQSREQRTLSLNTEAGIAHFDVKSIAIEELQRSTTTIRFLLVTTKAQQTLAALEAISHHIAADCSLIILQNGMAAVAVKEAFPRHRVYTAITNDGAYRTGPMAVTHAGRGTTYIDCPEELLQRLPTASLSIERSDNIDSRQWRKLAINCCINGLTAIYRCRNGELSGLAGARLQRLCREVAAIVTALGQPTAAAALAQNVHSILTNTAANYSSMHQDIEAQRDTEIAMLNGFLCRRAGLLAIACPENKRICTEIERLQQHGNSAAED